MVKRIFFLLVLFFLFVPKTYASTNSFVSIVNPVRGSDFWSDKTQGLLEVVKGQLQALKVNNLAATWLVRYDALKDSEVIDTLNSTSDEKGIFLEVTPTWTNDSGVKYHQSTSWHSAGSVFLTGYQPREREKLIDLAFGQFKKEFGVYPRSVGAWWVDAHSASYMQQKYGVTSVVVVADQYSTDNYQIWGGYWGSPYYPYNQNLLFPARSIVDKIPLVVTQWAARDPVNGYGKGVEDSTYSLQANDYLDYHQLGTDYFSKLIDLYMDQPQNPVNQVVVGLENSYSWRKYGGEYQRQIQTLAQKQAQAKLQVLSLQDFASWYLQHFPNLSPAQLIKATDPLGSAKQSVWFMNAYYRVGWFSTPSGTTVADLRQYLDGQAEPCLRDRCDSINFATFSTRVLDFVTYQNKWLLDDGLAHDLQINRLQDGYSLSFKNAVGTSHQLDFLLRDIRFDGNIHSIDGAILDAQKTSLNNPKSALSRQGKLLPGEVGHVFLSLLEFVLFLILTVFIPGILVTKNLNTKSPLEKLFLSTVVGLVQLTALSYLLGFLHLWWLLFGYVLISLVLFIKGRVYQKISLTKPSWMPLLLILAGSLFQIIPTVKSGLGFDFGVGFWGPNSHDGLWHLSLIQQLSRGLPAQNPIYAGVQLKNYHFFYDLLVAVSHFLSLAQVSDLLFRLYPLLFSLLLGTGMYLIGKNLIPNQFNPLQKKVYIFGLLYLTYFGGSFGWIVTWIKEKILSGESDFWVNQSISFNLNPPFAISLIVILAILVLLLKSKNRNWWYILVLLSGTLLGFKAYGAILNYLSLGLITLSLLPKRSYGYIFALVASMAISLAIYLPNFTNTAFFIWSPFWFIHSMMDFSDRVGWARLSAAREAYFNRGDWFKYFIVETLGLAIFLIGNLGVRFLGLLGLSKFRDSEIWIYLWSLILASFLIPIFLIQQGNPWNTIQFFYYGLYLITFATALVIAGCFKVRFLGWIVLGLVLTLGPINSLATAKSYLIATPHAYITTKEVQALRFLAAQPSGIVLTMPYNPALRGNYQGSIPLFAYDSTAYVSALAGKPTFIEDQEQNEILGNDYTKRKILAKEFINSNQLKPQLGALKYVYLLKVYGQRLDESKYRKIFENDQSLIYEINP